MNLTANWSYPTAIRFGAGRINELADACGAAGIRRPLLVTDRALAELPIVQAAFDLLDEAGPADVVISTWTAAVQVNAYTRPVKPCCYLFDVG